MPSNPSDLRKLLGTMIGLVLALHVCAMLLWVLAGVREAGERTRFIFTGVWLLLTLAIVLRWLWLIRLERDRVRRGRPGR
jgi:hypothetical protein